ncbi:hypothetical protein BD309DRAFT_1018960 [Dichomitus squalens]|uniref:Uncharacterized protein n=1 Tax=Dichomitus squalens TaxID=114155 RepID=A0A4Q9NV18_9APHY|nr:hypothetical protein BD309DRAFT_1018960 [Dichomitus squalens]TBU56669.1 hypothetical protein BD310DRAFT_978647 [Dichomitus squalens]
MLSVAEGGWGMQSQSGSDRAREVGGGSGKASTPESATGSVQVLDKLVLPTRTSVQVLKDATAVDDGLQLAQGHLEAIEEEIEGRRTHHRQFFHTSECCVGCKDDGHEHWLRKLQVKQATVASLLARLRMHKEHLLEEEEASRTRAEHTRRMDELVAEARAQRELARSGVHAGYAARAEWTRSCTYASVAAAPRPPATVRSTPSHRADPWAVDAERHRRAALWQTPPPPEICDRGGGIFVRARSARS